MTVKTIVQRSVYALAIVAYVFVASGYFSRLAQATPPRMGQFPVWFGGLATLYILSTPIVLAPLCVIAAMKHRSHGLLLLYYVGLLYVGIWGGVVLGHDQLAFDAPPGLQMPWQEQVTNSFVFLAISALLYLAPTGLIWGIARFLVLRRQSR